MTAAHRWSPLSEEEFFRWAQGRDGRYELVRGQPVLMAGADRRHNELLGNFYASLRRQLRGGRCVPFFSDFAVRIPGGNIRYPDVTVDCSRTSDTDLTATEPTVVVEVLSRSTSEIDRFIKLEEYKTVETLRHIVLVAPERPDVLIYSRADDGTWTSRSVQGEDGRVELPAIACAVPFSELYERL